VGLGGGEWLACTVRPVSRRGVMLMWSPKKGKPTSSQGITKVTI
jgi:hypothetical protein